MRPSRCSRPSNPHDLLIKVAIRGNSYRLNDSGLSRPVEPTESIRAPALVRRRLGNLDHVRSPVAAVTQGIKFFPFLNSGIPMMAKSSSLRHKRTLLIGVRVSPSETERQLRGKLCSIA